MAESTQQESTLQEELPNGELVDASSIEGMSELVEQIMVCAVDEAEQMLETGGTCPPFTILVKGEDLEIETHPGDSISVCMASARVAVMSEKESIDYYAFAYDGYVDTDRGHHDAIIVECAAKNVETCHVICCLYDVIDAEADELPTFNFDDENLVYLGESPSFFSSEYSFTGETTLEEDVSIPAKTK